MIVAKMDFFMGLLREDGTEPPAASGYTRVSVGKVLITSIGNIPYAQQIVFPDVMPPGYGNITDLALFLEKEGGEAVVLWDLPEPIDVHQGVVPVIHNGKLWRGVDTKATVTIQNEILSKMGGSL